MPNWQDTMSSEERRRLRILRTQAFNRQHGRCYWCGEPMLKESAENDPLFCSGDHVVRLCDGGKTEVGNVVSAHVKCNSGRHAEDDKSESEEVQTRAHFTVGDNAAASPFEALRALML